MPDRQPRLATRVWLPLASALLLFVAVAADAAHGLAAVTGQLDEIARVNNEQQRCAVQMREHLDEVAAAARDIVLEKDLTLIRSISDHVATESTAYDNDEATLGALLAGDRETSPQESALFARSAAEKAVAWPLITRVVALGSDNEDVQATRLFMAEAKPALARWRDTLTQLADIEAQQNQAAADEARAIYRRALTTLTVLCGTALVLGGLAAWTLVSRPAAADAPHR